MKSTLLGEIQEGNRPEKKKTHTKKQPKPLHRHKEIPENTISQKKREFKEEM